MSSILTGHYLIDSFRLPFSKPEPSQEENGSMSGSKKRPRDSGYKQITIGLGAQQQGAVLHIEEAAQRLCRPTQKSAGIINSIVQGCLIQVVLEAKVYDLVESFSHYVQVVALNSLIRDVLTYIEEDKNDLVSNICFDEDAHCYIFVEGPRISLMIQGYKIELNRHDARLEDALPGIKFHDKVDELSAVFSASIVREKLYKALDCAAFLSLNKTDNVVAVISGDSELKVSCYEGKISFEVDDVSVELNDQFIGRQVLSNMNFFSQAKLIAGAFNYFCQLDINDLLIMLRWIDKQTLEVGMDDPSFCYNVTELDLDISNKMCIVCYKGSYYIGYGDFVARVADGVLVMNPILFPLDRLDVTVEKLVKAFPSEAGSLDKERFKRILSSFSLDQLGLSSRRPEISFGDEGCFGPCPLDHSDLSSQKPEIALEINSEGRLFIQVKGYSVKLQNCEMGLNFYALDQSDLVLEDDQKENAEVFFKRYYQSASGTYNPTKDLEGILQYRVLVISPAYIMLATDEKIGSGAFKIVKKVINLITGKAFAWYGAQFKYPSLEEGVRVFDSKACEIDLMKSRKPGCVRSVCILERPLAGAGGVAVDVFMKMYELDLAKFSTKMALSNEVKLSLSRQIAQAIMQLHRDNKAHCDIKLSNILIKPSQKEGLHGFKAVLGDFGACFDLNAPDKQIKFTVFTQSFASPEFLNLLEQNPLSSKSLIDFKAFDTWSFGVLLYLLYLNKPFNKKDANLFPLQDRCRNPFPINYYNLATVHPMIYTIISNMLVPAEHRWTMERVVVELGKSEIESEIALPVLPAPLVIFRHRSEDHNNYLGDFRPAPALGSLGFAGLREANSLVLGGGLRSPQAARALGLVLPQISPEALPIDRLKPRGAVDFGVLGQGNFSSRRLSIGGDAAAFVMGAVALKSFDLIENDESRACYNVGKA